MDSHEVLLKVLDHRVQTVERAVEEIKEAVKEIGEATKVLAEVAQQGSAVKDHEERLRVLEKSLGKAEGMVLLVRWVGLPTVAGVLYLVAKQVMQ